MYSFDGFRCSPHNGFLGSAVMVRQLYRLREAASVQGNEIDGCAVHHESTPCRAYASSRVASVSDDNTISELLQKLRYMDPTWKPLGRLRQVYSCELPHRQSRLPWTAAGFTQAIKLTHHPRLIQRTIFAASHRRAVERIHPGSDILGANVGDDEATSAGRHSGCVWGGQP